MEKRLNKWHSYIEGDSGKTGGDSKPDGQSQTSLETTSDSAPVTNNSSSESAVADENSAVHDVGKASNDANAA